MSDDVRDSSVRDKASLVNKFTNKVSPCIDSDSDRQSSLIEEVQITLMAFANFDSKMDTLLGETLGCVLLHSECSRTVCDKKRLKCYL